MPIILDNHLLDLGTAGLLAITTESDHAPVLAMDACFARWIDEDGGAHDRRELLAIEVDAKALRAGIAERGGLMRRAVASVLGQWQWLSKRAAGESQLLFPCEVVAMQEGRVLAIYCAPGIEPRLRLLDVPKARELWALSDSELRREWQVAAPAACQRMLGLGMMAKPRVMAHGRSEACIAIDLSSFLIRPQIDAHRAEHRGGSRAVADTCYAGAWRIERAGERDSKLFSVVRVDASSDSQTLTATLPGWVFDIFGAADADTVVLSHAGGSLALYRLPSDEPIVLRPFPKLARDAQVYAEFESLGRSFIARHGFDIAVVDLGGHRRAAIDFYPNLDFDRNRFNESVSHRASLLLRNGTLLMLHGNRLTTTPFNRLHWEALAERPLAANGHADATVRAHVVQLAESLKLPRIDAEVAKPQPASSTLVLGHYALMQPWAKVPSYKGVDMALLCQMDWELVAGGLGTSNPFPATGCLLVFVSVDESGELVGGDDLGTPAELVVLHVDTKAPVVSIPARKRNQTGPRALQLIDARMDLPEVDSVHVDAMLNDAESIESYRALLPQRGDADAANPPVRLGGYPLPLQNNDIEFEAANLAQLRFDRETSAHEWRLLLQLESDEYMWGTDSGCLYLMIHLHDLKARDFSQVVWVAQGY